MIRLASSLAVGDTVGASNAVVVAIEPLNDDMLRITLFVDGEVRQQDAYLADGFDNAKSPPMLLEALQSVSDLFELCAAHIHAPTTPAERRARDMLAAARRLGIMVRYGGVYSVRK